jgi:hypothetical protein
VTAVTTAGLLAGLFGSAFVPAVRAAADDATTVGATCTSADSTGTFADLAQKCTYVSTVKPVISIPVVYTDAGNDVGVYSVTVSGSTFYSSSITRVNTGAGTVVLNTADTLRDNVTTAAAADGATYVLTLNLIAAGSSATVKVTDDDSTIITLTVASVAAAKANLATPYTSVVLDQTTTRTITDDVTANSAAGIAGTTSVNSSVDYVSAAFGTDGVFEWVYKVRDAYATKTMDLSAKQFTAAVSPTTCGTVDIGSSSANAVNSFAATTSAVGVDGSANNTTNNLFVGWKHPGADKGCLATITITESATGTVIDTFKIGALGETASVTLTGPSHVAANLATDEDMEGQLVIVAKDSNGITIPGTFANPSFTAKDADGVALTITPTDTPDADVLGAGGTVGNAEEGGTADDNKFGFLATGLCPADSEGKVRTIYAEGETLVATGKAKSNTISVTCTGKLAYVSAVAFGKTSYYPSESATVTFTMKDSAGRTAGVGSYMVGTGYAIANSPATGGSATTEPAAIIDSLDTNNDGADAAEKGILVQTAGTYEYAYVMGTAAGVAGFLFDITDNDGVTAGNQQGLFTVKTVVSAAFAAVSDATISAGAKKKIATATFGAAAGKKVAFVLENASGVTKTYYRKANASGVAKYTIALRGTWTVYATFGDEITDTVTLRK